MSFVNPDTIRKIFAGTSMGGALDPSTPQGQQAIAMLAGAGSGMTQAAGQPGAGFAQAMGGGAQGMMQGQQHAQQQQMGQMQMQQMQQQLERQERISKILGDLTGSRRPDFASQVDAQLPQAPSLTQPQQGPAQATPLQGRGQISAQYESGGGGVGTVSSGRGDPGGVSYGRHQLSSNAGTMQSFLQSPEGQPFATQFGDFEPGSDQFNQIYQEIAQGAGPQFEQAQQQFLERTHVQPVMEMAQKAGLPVDNPAIQEALYSQAIQHGGQGNLEIINRAMASLGPDADPEQVIDALYDAREPYAVQALRRTGASEDVIKGVRNRYRDERNQVKAALGERVVQPGSGPGPLAQGQPQQAPQQAPTAQQAPMNGYQQNMMRQAQQGAIPPQAAELLSLMDPDQAIKALWDMQNPKQGEMPAAVRELQWAFGGDDEAARQAWHAAQEAKGEGGPQDQRDRKIRDYQELYDVDRNVATAMADGIIKPIYNEQLGRTVLMDYRDPMNPQVREVEIAPARQPEPEEAPERTLFEIARGGNIAGVVPSASEKLGSVTGQFGLLSDRQKQAAEDRQTVLLTNRGLIRALQDSPMYAQREREAIERDIGINPSAFDSEEQLLSRMKAVHGVLTRKRAEAQRIEGDPRLGDEIRRQAQQSVRDIDAYLLQMGDPEQQQGGGTADLPPAPEGVPADAWQFMTDEERALWQN